MFLWTDSESQLIVVTVVLMFKNELCMVYLGVNGDRISSCVVDGTRNYVSEVWPVLCFFHSNLDKDPRY